MSVDQLTLGEKAAIEGSVLYSSRNLITQALGASIAGDLLRNDPVAGSVDNESLFNALTPALMILFATLAWYLLSRKTLSAVAIRPQTHSLRSVLAGSAVVFLTPLLISLLLLSMIGALVGIVLFLFYLLVLILSVAASTAIMGRFAFQLFRAESELALPAVLLGAVLTTFCFYLPLIGGLILISVYVLAVGSIVDQAVEHMRKK